MFCKCDKLSSCRNYKKLCLYYPKINNIFNDTIINYTYIKKNSDINDDIFVNIFLSFLELIKYIKAYLLLTLFNFLIDNYDLTLQHNLYKSAQNKIYGVLNNDYCIELIKKHNIDINKWVDIFSDLEKID